MLPLTFTNPQDYNKVDPSDLVSIVGLADNSMQLTLLLHKERGDTVKVPLSHTFSKGKSFFLSQGSWVSFSLVSFHIIFFVLFWE